MSKIFYHISIYFLLFSLNISATENNLVIRGTQNLPIEINLVLESLQKTPLAAEEFKTLKEQVTRIESYAKNLTKEEIFFISKTSFYKTLLISSKRRQKNFFDGTSLRNLSEAKQKTSDPFLKWFFGALEKDALTVTKLPLYLDYLAARNVGRIDKIELRKIDKKVQLISWWIAKISPESPDLILKEINPLLQEILNKTEQSFYLLSNLSKVPSATAPKKDAPLTFFSIEEAPKKTTAQAAPTPSVNEIIDSVPTPAVTLPTPSNEDWLLGDEPTTPAPIKAIDSTEDL